MKEQGKAMEKFEKAKQFYNSLPARTKEWLPSVEDAEYYVRKDDEYRRMYVQKTSEKPRIQYHNNSEYGREHNGTSVELLNQAAYYKRCVAARKQSEKATAYLIGRGLSEKIQDWFRIGYDPAWHHPGTRNRPTERIIIPNSPGSYLARVLDDTQVLGPYDHQKMKVGRQHLFNSKAICPESVVFVVEGEIDEMSIAQFGIPCVGLGSAAQYRKLTEYLRLNPDCAKGTFFLICLDDDRTGKERAKDLSNLLIEEGYRCARFNGISAPFKDPNERLQMDPEGLGQALKRAWDECQKLRLRRETA